MKDFYWGQSEQRNILNNRQQFDLIHYKNGLRHASGSVQHTIPPVTYNCLAKMKSADKGHSYVKTFSMAPRNVVSYKNLAHA